MELNPRQLDAFRKVMVTGSMTVAAELLGITQPAVSKLIRELEANLAVRLFRREGNRLIPGAEAQRLFKEVDRFYVGIEQIERVARDLKSVRIGTLRIASMSALALSVLCEGIRRFSELRPGVATSLDVRNSIGVLELAASNQIDIGFIHRMSADYPGVDVRPLPSVPAVCVLPRDHRLAQQESIRLTDLEGESLITLGENNPLRMRLDLELAQAGVNCRRPVETTLAYSACNLVAGNLGLSVVDSFTAQNYSNPAVVWRPLLPVIAFECAMVLPAHQPRSKALDDFIHVTRDLFASTVAAYSAPAARA